MKKSLLLLAAALFLRPVAAEAAKSPSLMRVAITPVPSYHGTVPTSDTERHLIAMAGYFRDKLDDCQSIRLISEPRVSAMFSALSGGSFWLNADLHFDAANAILPVDAMITFPAREGQASARIVLSDGVLNLPVGPRNEALPALIQRAGNFLADALSLSEDERRLLLDNEFPPDDAMATYYLASRFSVHWMYCPGEARLTMLLELWSKHRGDMRLGHQVLRSAAVQMDRAIRRRQAVQPRPIQMAQVSLPTVLGTRYEPTAAEVVRLQPGAFARVLIDLAQPFTRNEEDLDAMLDDLIGGPVTAAPILSGLRTADDAEAWGGAITDAVRAGALRLLGFVRTKAAADLVMSAAVHPKADVRQATAVALGRMEDQASATALRKLLNDQDPVTAFLAARGLADRGTPPDDLLRRALAVADTAPELVQPLVLDTVAEKATAAQTGLLRAWSGSGEKNRERVAYLALLRLDPNAADPQELLDDPRTEVVAAAIAAGATSDQPVSGWLPQLIRLANEPLAALNEPARRLLVTNRPTDPIEALVFELNFEHSYRRRQIIDLLAKPASIDQLAMGLKNRDPHTRTRALERLTQVDASRGRTAVMAALNDLHEAVRFTAARMAVQTATSADRGALETAYAAEKDPSIRLYLADALAAIGAAEPPPPQPAAHSVAAARSLTWVNNMGLDAEHSPFGAYYNFIQPTDRDLWERAHKAGKIVFVRFMPIGHPGMITVQPGGRETFQRRLKQQVNLDTLHLLDGMVFGEESMKAGANDLWPEGWLLFCRDAGIDAATVDGKLDNLTVPQRRAWNRWATDRTTEGFNEMTAYVREYFGRMRPGIQVATFMPGLDWDFDVAGIYDYKGDNRLAAYNLVRSFKTLWPDRPVIWLSLGIGGYEMNPVRRTQSVPQSPLFTRGNRAYADSMTAWIAGADAGWFSTWIFVAPDFKGGLRDLKGKQILVEDITEHSPVLASAIEYAFKGAADDILAAPMPDAPGDSTQDLLDGDALRIADELIMMVDEDERREQAAASVADQIEMFRRGFHFYRRYVYDCARVFAGLPRRNPRPQVLSIRPGVSVWTRPGTSYPLVPAEALLNEYDFLGSINNMTRLDLSRYRMIILHAPGEAEAGTLKAIAAWLRDTPGLLYLHRAPPQPLSEDAAAAAAAAEWPWRSVSATMQLRDVAGVRQRPEPIELRDAKGKTRTVTAIASSRIDTDGAGWNVLQRDNEGQATLALWRDPSSARGVIVLDALESGDAEYLKLLRETLNHLAAEHKVGLPISGPLLQIRSEDQDFVAAATTRYYGGVPEVTPLEGIDLLSGQMHPAVGEYSTGAVVPVSDLQARYTAAGAGLTAIADRPFTRAETAGKALVLQSDSLFRISAGTASVNVTLMDGKPLKLVEDDPWAWVEWGETEGIFVQSLGEHRGPMVYVRSTQPVRAVTVKN